MSKTYTWLAWVGLNWLSSRMGTQRKPWVGLVVHGMQASCNACRPRRRMAVRKR